MLSPLALLDHLEQLVGEPHPGWAPLVEGIEVHGRLANSSTWRLANAAPVCAAVTKACTVWGGLGPNYEH